MENQSLRTSTNLRSMALQGTQLEVTQTEAKYMAYDMYQNGSRMPEMTTQQTRVHHSQAHTRWSLMDHHGCRPDPQPASADRPPKLAKGRRVPPKRPNLWKTYGRTIFGESWVA